MKKTYMQPSAEVMNINGRDALMAVMSISNDTVNTSDEGVQLGREEEDFGGPWDTAW